MKTNIYFARHAHSTYTPDELNRSLSEKGFKDAERVTKLLSRENITHVISSPYKRALQTVEDTAKLSGLDIIIDEGFRERKLADGSVDNFNEVILNAWKNFHFFLPGGESGYCAQKRGLLSLENTIEKYKGGNIVIGTHGNIMTLIMNYYDKKYGYDFWVDLSMPDIYKLSFENKKLVKVKRVWK